MKYLAIILALSASTVSAETVYISDIPDFTQTDIDEAQYGYGKQLCGPVAVSNAISWLSGKAVSQEEIIKRLFSDQYMSTSLKDGTGTVGMLRGIDKITTELIGEFSSLEYQGWRLHPKQYSTGVSTPSLEWIKNGVSDSSAVFLNIGWYQAEGANTYRRTGGHWVTLVGYTSESLILHDPAPRAGKSFSNEDATVLHLLAGTLTGNKKGLPREAVGFIHLKGGMHLKRGSDLAVIDGAIKVKL